MPRISPEKAPLGAADAHQIVTNRSSREDIGQPPRRDTHRPRSADSITSRDLTHDSRALYKTDCNHNGHVSSPHRHHHQRYDRSFSGEKSRHSLIDNNNSLFHKDRKGSLFSTERRGSERSLNIRSDQRPVTEDALRPVDVVPVGAVVDNNAGEYVSQKLI